MEKPDLPEDEKSKFLRLIRLNEGIDYRRKFCYQQLHPMASNKSNR